MIQDKAPADNLGAFCADSAAYLPGVPGGSLSGLSFAAKDIFDVVGHVTGCGNPDWKNTHRPAERTAWAVQVLVDNGATMVGKTLTDELTRGIFGENAHYGTPVNPRAPGRVPGGSSSGSAVAVAAGLVDFALGSDTGGSVRVPASFCGLYGLRPTHNRIALEGMLLQAPSYDTIGWFTRDIDTFARVAAVLLQSEITGDRPQRLVVAEDAFELADPEVMAALLPSVELVSTLVGSSTTVRLAPIDLAEWSAQQQVLQGREAWNSARDWIERTNPRFSFEVSDRYIQARAITDAQVDSAKRGRATIVDRMRDVLQPGTIVCLPTTVGPAPPAGEPLLARTELRLRNAALTSIAGNAGLPQLSMPLASVGGLPIGLSLLGPPGSDASLIELAREISVAVGG